MIAINNPCHSLQQPRFTVLELVNDLQSLIVIVYQTLSFPREFLDTETKLHCSVFYTSSFLSRGFGQLIFVVASFRMLLKVNPRDKERKTRVLSNNSQALGKIRK